MKVFYLMIFIWLVTIFLTYSTSDPDLESELITNYTFDFSDPESIIGKGTNVMILGGNLSLAYLPQSLECFLVRNNFSMKPISKDFAIELNNASRWIWYDNNFYFLQRSFYLKEKIDLCYQEPLYYYTSGEYTSPMAIVPKRVIAKIEGDLDPLWISTPEIKPTINLAYTGSVPLEELYTSFIDLNGHNSYNIKPTNDYFIFDKKVLLENKNKFIFPFDSFKAQINFSPPIVIPKNLTISLIGDQNLDGVAYFLNDNVVLEFKRTNKFRVLSSFVVLIVSLIILIYRIKYLKKSSLNPKNLVRDWSFILSIFFLVVYITSSFKNGINLINIILITFLIFVIKTIFKKVKKLMPKPQQQPSSPSHPNP